MNRTSLLNRSMFAALLLSASVSVFAGEPASAQTAPQTIGVADTASGQGSQAKTRAQVRAELIQAEKAGLIPAGNARFPAGPNTMARNKVNFQKAQSWWTAHGQGAAWGS